MNLFEFSLLAFSSLFVIVDPIATVPTFLAMTQHDTPATRIKAARLACTVAAAILLLFAATGHWIFQALGISLPAVQMFGCLVLLKVAIDMLQARRSAVQETREEANAGVDKEDVAVTPLAVPMLAGPGAMATAIMLHNRVTNLSQEIALYLCIGGVCLVSFLILWLSSHGAKWLNPIAMRVTTRIMGLLLGAVAMQFLINALVELKKQNVF